jgi:hypothetical protein
MFGGGFPVGLGASHSAIIVLRFVLQKGSAREMTLWRSIQLHLKHIAVFGF